MNKFVFLTEKQIKELERPSSHYISHPLIMAYREYKSCTGHKVSNFDYAGLRVVLLWEKLALICNDTTNYIGDYEKIFKEFIGDDLAKDIIWFLRMPVISFEDIINHNYSYRALEMGIAESHRTAAGLACEVSEYDYEKIEVAKEFLEQVEGTLNNWKYGTYGAPIVDFFEDILERRRRAWYGISNTSITMETIRYHNKKLVKQIEHLTKKETPIINPYIYAYIEYERYIGSSSIPSIDSIDIGRLNLLECVSTLLWNTKQPERLEKIIGYDKAVKLKRFEKQQVISLKDVINHNYSSKDLEMDVSQKFATAVSLASVDDEHFEVVRDFMEQVGSEPSAVFEVIWSHNLERFENVKTQRKIEDYHAKKSVEQVSNTSNFDDVSGKDIDNKKSVANKTSDDFDFVNVPEENIENKEPDETQIFGAINFDNNSEEDTESKESFANKTSNDFDSVSEEDTESKELAEKQVFDTVNFADDSEETETKIHPYVYAYIAYKSYSGDKLNVEPKTWEIVSKVLYKTKQPDVLRKLLGDDLTNDFIAFTNQQVISLENVINHNYSKEDLEMNTSQKFATAASLAFVNDEQFGVVRDFMKQVGTTSMSVFEFMWAYGDESRLEKIAEAQMIDGLSQRKTKVRRKKKN